MQQHHGSSDEEHDSQGKEEGFGFGDIPPVTGTAIAVWIFLLGGFVLRVFINAYISDTAEAAKVWVESIFSLALVIVVVIQACIYFRQAKALDNSLEIARKSMVYAQRAYLFICEPSIDALEGVGGTYYSFRFKVKNFGSTPANNVTIFAYAGMWEEPPEPGRGADSADWHGLGLIPAGESLPEISPANIKTEADWACQRRESWSMQKRDFYCWGMIEYEDIFGEERTTWFCLVESLAPPARIRFCETGNKAT